MNILSDISILYTDVIVPVMDALDCLFSCFTCFLLYHLMPNKMVVLNIHSAAHVTFFIKEGTK